LSGLCASVKSNRPPRRWLQARQLLLEELEDRTVLSTVDFGGLHFVADGNFLNRDGDQVVSGGHVLIGNIPPTSAFHALVDVDLGGPSDGTLRIKTDSSPATFQIADGKISSVVQTGVSLPIWQTKDATTAVNFVIPQLFSSNGLSLLDPTTMQPLGQPIPLGVAGVNFTVNNLSFTLPNPGDPTSDQVEMQGSVAFPALAGLDLVKLQVVVNGGNYVHATSTGLTLDGVTAVENTPTIHAFDLDITGQISVSYSHTTGGDNDFTIGGGVKISTEVQQEGGGLANGFNGLGGHFNLTIENGAFDALGGDFAGDFAIHGVQVSTDAGNPLTFNYEKDSDSFNIQGGLTFKFLGNTVDVNLGFANNPDAPGISIENGELTQVNATVNGTLMLFGTTLTTNNNGLTFSYDQGKSQYEMYGSLMILLPTAGGKTNSITATMGNSTSPGLLIQNGNLQQIELSVSGQFDVYGLTLQVGNGQFVWTKQGGGDIFVISGTFTLKGVFQVSVTLGQPGGGPNSGLEIKDGQMQVDSFTIDAKNINLGGVFTIIDLMVTWSKPTNTGDYTAGFSLQLLFPGGWWLSGSLTLTDDHVSSISVGLGTRYGVAVGDTGLFIVGAAIEVQNIDTPENIMATGELAVTYGDEVDIDGQNLTAFAAWGSVTASRNELIMTANYASGAKQSGTDQLGLPVFTGVFGSGSGTLTLDWSQHVYSAALHLSMYAGVFTLDASFSFQGTGNSYDLLISAKADVNVPDAVPFIGGKTLAGLEFVFEYHHHPNSSPTGFAAAWVEVDIIHKFDIGLEYDLGSHLSVIGTSAVNSIMQCLANPSNCPGSNGSYTYSSTFVVPDGATSGTLQVAWPTQAGSQTVEVLLPGQTTPIPTSMFDPSVNGLSVMPAPLSTPTSTAVTVVGSSSHVDAPLPSGEYQLILISSYQFSTPPTFTATFSHPTPTIQVGSVPSNPEEQVVPVPLSGTVDEAFGSQTTVSLFVDTDNQGHDGTPIPGAQGIPVTTDGMGNWTPDVPLYWTLTNQLPVPFYFYAVVNDGTNTPVLSCYSTAVTPTPPLSGTVADVEHNLGVSGLQVYLDANGNGQYDPGDPVSITNTNGFYAFYNLTPGTRYSVGLLLPPGVSMAPEPNNENPRTVAYKGDEPIAANFDLDFRPSISGTVYDDGNGNGKQDPGEPGLAGFTVTASDKSGLCNSMGGSAVTDSLGHYRILNLSAGCAYTVSLQPLPNYFQTAPARDYDVALIDPHELAQGKDFGVRQYPTVAGQVQGYPSGQNTLGPAVGWTVNLVNGNGVAASAITAADGTYSITNAPAGSYTIQLVPQAGWRQFEPLNPSFGMTQYANSDQHGPADSVATGDFDGDGYQDVATIAAGTNAVTLFWGNPGNPGTFDSEWTYSLPVYNVWKIFALPDVGKRPSLAVVTTTGKVYLLQNAGLSGSDSRGSTAFNAATLLWQIPNFNPDTTTLVGAATGDFDGDGLIDLALSVRTSSSVYSWGSTYVFTRANPMSPTSLFGSLYGGPLAAGDINGDGHLDLVVADTVDSSQVWTVLYGNGTGGMTPGASYPLSVGSAADIAVADINLDGHLDVLVRSAGAFQLFLQQPDGTFQSDSIVNVSSNDWAIADFNGDLRPDVAYDVYVPGSTPSNGTYRVYFEFSQASSPYFPASQSPTPVTQYLYDAPPSVPFTALAADDFNNDGLTDLVVGADEPTLSVYLNTSTGSTGIPVTTADGQLSANNDFLVYQYGQVTGQVYDDLDRDGRLGPADRGLAGVTVYLDLNRNGALDPGEPVAVTNRDGVYSFEGVPDGRYQVRLLTPPGRVSTTADLYEVEVVNGRAAGALNFGTAVALVMPLPDQAVAQGTRLTVAAMPTGAIPEGRLAYRLDDGAPAGAHIDARTGEFTWTPAPGQQPGQYPVTVRVSDLSAPLRTEAQTFTVTVVTPNVAYVQALYRALLGRAADVPGLNSWVGLLDAGAPLVAVSTGIWNSPEHRGIEVDEFYATYLHRKADPGGRVNWVRALLAGLGETTVARLFLTSPEYTAAHPSTTSFVRGVYADVLSRAADPIGQADWQQVGQLPSGRQRVAEGILSSPEAQRRLVDQYYETFLRRSPDRAGAEGWLTRLRSGQASLASAAEGFLASEEFFAQALVEISS
jgi:hypothetical protein